MSASLSNFPGMMDIIRLDNIDLFAYHGVAQEERETGQHFTLEIELYTDLTAAAQSDDLAATLNYATAYSIVAAAFCAEPHQLLERAAWRVLEELFKGLSVDEIGIRVRKVAPPIDGFTGGAEIELLRTREEVLGG